MIRKLAYLLMLYLSAGTGLSHAAEDANKLPGELRKFDQQKLDSLRASREYTYEAAPTPDAGWLEQLYNELVELFAHKTFGAFWEVFPYIFVGIVVIVVVMNLLNASVSGFIKSEGSSTQINYKVEDEHIHEIDFEKEIAQAIELKLFRKAVRLHYLRTLKKLSDKKLIHWEIDKTNQEYSRELRISSLHPDFSQITLAFEKCWYGNQHVDYNTFETIKLSFNDFERQIEREK